MIFPNHYATLGLPETASPAAIERRYRDLAKRNHPDRGRGGGEVDWRTDRMAAINVAASVLRDPNKRAVYDADLAASRRADSRSSISGAEPAGEWINPYPFTCPFDEASPKMSTARRSGSTAARSRPWQALSGHRRRPQPNLVDWYGRTWIGQWVLVAVVGLLISTMAVWAPDSHASVIAVGVGAWLIAGAAYTRDLGNPLGDLLRLGFRLLLLIFSMLDAFALTVRSQEP